MAVRSLLYSAASLSAIAVPSALSAQAGSETGGAIIVTATPLAQTADETATPVIALSGDELVQRRRATLGETLEGQPGIHFDNFGGGASRPVIRGQTAPRVEVLSDSSQIEDASTISPDHAVTTEPLLLRGIEVLRGPATLLYGGGAIGGVVNLLDDKIPTAVPERGITGVAEGRLGTGDRERSLVGGVTAGAGPFAFRVEGVHRNSDDYRVPRSFGERRIDGSFNDTSTFSAGGSVIFADGYLGAAYTRQRSEYGLPGHNHEFEDCHPHGSALHCGSHDSDHDHDHDHGHDEVPFVNLRSDRIDVRGEYRNPIAGIEQVRFRTSFTDYEHDEIEHDEVATTFKNKAHDIRLELTHAPIAGIRGVLGLQHSNSDFSTMGQEQFLPPSETRNTALFLMESYQAGTVRLEAAARHEWQSIETEDGREARHRPFSLSGAAIWDIDGDISLALAVARSQRAPNVQELYSNTLRPYRGVHLATNTWELGTPTLDKETSRSVDLTLRKRTGPTTFTLGAYHQDFNDYIFAETVDIYPAEPDPGEDIFRLIRYTAADATFTGIEGEVRHQVAHGFALSLFGDYVRAKLKDGRGDLPRIPAGRLGARADGHWGPFSAHAEYYRMFEQEDVGDFETNTPGYDMLSATLAYKIELDPTSGAELFVRGTNLANELAFNHASFVKNASPLRGRNFVFGVRTLF